MAEETGILWADATLNFWIGCTKVSPACDNCYAEKWGARFGVKWGAKAERRRCVKNRAKAHKLQKLAVTRKVRNGQPFFCFSNSLSDIFDNAVPISWLREAFEDMRASPDVTYLLLTKRPQNIVKMIRALAEADLGPYADAAGIRAWLPKNIAFGCTAVNQDEYKRDVLVLLNAKEMLNPAFIFVSIEPMLGPITTVIYPPASTYDTLSGWQIWDTDSLQHLKVDWIIVGGESGAEARPINPDWVRQLRDECADAGTPFLWKQWGEFVPEEQAPEGAIMPSLSHRPWGSDGPRVFRAGTKVTGHLLDGVEHVARPIPKDRHAQG